MFPILRGRLGHYLLLTSAWAVLSLINLGGPSLWDIDEGNNAEAAREMYVSGNWIVPTFNFELRVDKPALLYWLQATAYHFFGVNEFAARLPSALAALASVLLTYELGRRMFGSGCGLLAGLVLASTVSFCAAAHFANPDALLNLCVLAGLLLFWRGFERGGNSWLVWGGVTTGFGMLAKGPIGLLLPWAVVLLFLGRSGQLRRIWHPCLWYGLLTFLLVAAPWYAWVAADTKAEFLRGFLLKHNVQRYLDPMESHGGPLYYYAAVLPIGFAPWSVFFVASAWHAWRVRREGATVDSRYRFLACWVATVFVFFSLAGTKLPNYVLPLYPPLAVVVAHFLDRWRRGEVRPPAWVLHASLGFLVLTGVGTSLGLLVGGGTLGGDLLRGRQLPGLEHWAFVGALPVLAGLSAWVWSRQGKRGPALAAVALASVLFTSTCAAWATVAVDRYKAPRPLAAALRQHDTGKEILVGAFGYFQPSLVFYCGREVVTWPMEEQALESLRSPLPTYLFLPAAEWERLHPRVAPGCRELARHRDLYRGFEVVLVVNR